MSEPIQAAPAGAVCGVTVFRPGGSWGGYTCRKPAKAVWSGTPVCAAHLAGKRRSAEYDRLRDEQYARRKIEREQEIIENARVAAIIDCAPSDVTPERMRAWILAHAEAKEVSA